MINLKINPKLKIKIKPELLKKAGHSTVEYDVNPDGSDLSLVITTDEQLKNLNRQYRGIDATTDVLSFAAGEKDPDTGNNYLGDVIISYPQALAQASLAGHPVETELQLLTIHGILHLLGFDHSTEAEKARMWEVQGKILADLGIGGIWISEGRV